MEEKIPELQKVNSVMSAIKENGPNPQQNNKRVHPVTGYADSENMWQKLASLEKDNIPAKNKYPNKRSQFVI